MENWVGRSLSRGVGVGWWWCVGVGVGVGVPPASVPGYRSSHNNPDGFTGAAQAASTSKKIIYGWSKKLNNGPC